jgi:hypothetical protein
MNQALATRCVSLILFEAHKRSNLLIYDSNLVYQRKTEISIAKSRPVSGGLDKGGGGGRTYPSRFLIFYYY